MSKALSLTLFFYCLLSSCRGDYTDSKSSGKIEIQSLSTSISDSTTPYMAVREDYRNGINLLEYSEKLESGRIIINTDTISIQSLSQNEGSFVFSGKKISVHLKNKLEEIQSGTSCQYSEWDSLIVRYKKNEMVVKNVFLQECPPLLKRETVK